MLNVKYGEKVISVESDYNARFVKKARALHGTWERSAWIFNADQIDAVRKALVDCYGDDGLGKRVKVHIDLDKCQHLSDGYPSLYFADSCLIATRFSRDSEVKLPDDVFCVDGEFTSSGGSVKHPHVNWYDGTVVELYIPQTVYEQYKDDEGLSLVESQDNEKKKALEQEKAKLLQRIKEIDEELSKL